MTTTSHPAALDITLLCRLRAAVQWLETPRPFASVPADLADLMKAAAPLVADVVPPRTEADLDDPLTTLAALHGYYAADPEVARADTTLLAGALDAARGVLLAGFRSPVAA